MMMGIIVTLNAFKEGEATAAAAMKQDDDHYNNNNNNRPYCY